MKVYCPWTDKEVNDLKKRQNMKKVRPYRCEMCNEILIPTEFGFVCSNPDCDFMQNWALAIDFEDKKDDKNENSNNRRYT
jgi:hypothetical protein